MRERTLTRLSVVAAASLLVAAGLLPAIAFQSGTPRSDVEADIPPEEAKRANPVEANEFSIDNGSALFASQCAMCHGPTGQGDGKLAQRLNLAMPDFTDVAQQKSRTDGEYFYVLTHGHGRMPGDGERLAENSRWDLVNYIRTLDD